jgi:hypothetical protein
MEVKLECIKTVQRLVNQKQYKVLMIKLIGWIQKNEIDVPSLLFNCKTRKIPVPHYFILTKIGMICVFTIISIKFSQKGLISIIFEKVV